jgi:hypothetical protein
MLHAGRLRHRATGSGHPARGREHRRDDSQVRGADARLDLSGRHSDGRGRRVADHPGWRQWSHMPEALGVAEQAEHETVLEPGGTGREETQPARSPELFANLLVWWPRLASGAGNYQAHPLQALCGSEVSDLEPRLDGPPPQVPRHLLGRWNARFGEMPVPLGPDRGLVAGEVQRLDARPMLPATVGGRDASRERVGSVHRVAPPSTLPEGDRVDVEGHAQAAPGSSKLETRRATRA